MYKNHYLLSRAIPTLPVEVCPIPTVDVMETLFDKYLSTAKIYANRDVLRHDYMPTHLPHRDEHIQRLAGILAPALHQSKISNVFVYGKTGTGKTIVTKFVIDRLERKALEIGAPVKIAYINCRLAGTNYRVLAEICRAVGVEVPFTGIAVGELLDRFANGINADRTALLVTLDEIDALIKHNADDSLLYELTRINETLNSSWISIVGISNDLHFKEFLDPRVLSSLSEEEVVFRPYLADELFDILLERTRLAFLEGALDDNAIRLCAALAAGEHGDARRALDLLRVAGELAEREGATQVTEQNVRQAQQKIEHDRVSEVLKSLPAHSKILLVGAYLLSNHLSGGAITGDVYEVYHELCAASDLEPLTQRRVSGLINELDVMGILNARVVSFGRYGRTKKIRIGVAPRVISDTYADDNIAGRLVGLVPKSLQKHHSTQP
ncbi:MAG TPA: orc1/cdc6 family replication initiation protein [Terriglobales bacterium]|nr:orc1/cdc6 family replication initiation protein [Terriglobales bacterium]